MGVGFSRTGAMQTDPEPDSAERAGLNRIATIRITMLILKAVLWSGLYAWLERFSLRDPAHKKRAQEKAGSLRSE